MDTRSQRWMPYAFVLALIAIATLAILVWPTEPGDEDACGGNLLASLGGECVHYVRFRNESRYPLEVRPNPAAVLIVEPGSEREWVDIVRKSNRYLLVWPDQGHRRDVRVMYNELVQSSWLITITQEMFESAGQSR